MRSSRGLIRVGILNGIGNIFDEIIKFTIKIRRVFGVDVEVGFMRDFFTFSPKNVLEIRSV